MGLMGGVSFGPGAGLGSLAGVGGVIVVWVGIRGVVCDVLEGGRQQSRGDSRRR